MRNLKSIILSLIAVTAFTGIAGGAMHLSAQAQDSALITSGMGGGASSTARLTAQQAQQRAWIEAIQACGDSGQLYGANHGNVDGNDCILNMDLLNGGGASFVGDVGITSNAGMLDLIGSDHSYIQYFPDGAGAGRKAYVGFGSAPSDGFSIFNETASGPITIGTNSAGRIWVLPNGRVGIAASAPTHGLHVNSTFRVNSSSQLDGALSVGGTSSFADNISVTGTATVSGSVTAQTYYHTSDARLKTAIRPLEDSEDIISRLRPVRYYWTENSAPSIGFIAQEVEQVIPEAVKTNAAGFKAVDYDLIAAPVVATLQQQQRQLEAQAKEIETLKDMVRALSNQGR